MREAFPQDRYQHGIAPQSPGQRPRVAQLGRAQDVTHVVVALEQRFQGAQIALRVRFPAVVQKHPSRAEEMLPGVLEVLLRLAEQKLRNASARVVHRQLLFLEVLPDARQPVVVGDPVRVLQPAQKGLATLQLGARGQLAARQILLGETPVLGGGSRLYPLTHLQIAQIAKGDAEDVQVFSRIA